MNTTKTEIKRPDYGLDAPGLARGMALAGAAALLAAAGGAWLGHPWGTAAAALAGAAAAYLLGLALWMVVASRVVKVRLRERLLDLVPWAGTESVLDIGCGRGLLLVAAARRLTSGSAVGLDLWRAEDQSGNSADAARQNARLEGVADRVQVRTGDMRDLPFPDGSFDLVVSHWAVHNLESAGDRAQALAEAVRVLRPGGRVVLADIAGHAEYAERLTALGLTEIRRESAGWPTGLLGLVSLGQFRPAAVLARKAGERPSRPPTPEPEVEGREQEQVQRG